MEDSECNFCGEEFKSIELHSIHLINVHPGQSLKSDAPSEKECVHCGKIFDTNRLLKKHTTSVHDKKMCDMCNQVISNVWNLRKHILEVHRNIRKYQCIYCEKHFSRRSILKVHTKTCIIVDEIKREMYPDTENILCEYCNKMFNNIQSFLRHKKKNHKVIKKTTKKRKRRIKKKLVTHEKSTDIDALQLKENNLRNDCSPIGCDICGMSYKSRKALKTHFKIKHSGKVYECNTCHKRFQYKQVLQKHKVTHTNPVHRFKKPLELLGRTQRRKRLREEFAVTQSAILQE